MGWVMAPTRHLRNALYGNVVLSRFPVTHHQQYDLSWKTCEPRLAQRVDLAIDGADVLHFYNVHLGTALLERRDQARRLASVVHDRRVSGPKIVLGDFNEWARGLATDVLAEKLQSIDLRQHLQRKRTYPGFFPLVHLDHIYYEGARVEIDKVWLPKDRMAMMASDHLPLVADLKLRFWSQQVRAHAAPLVRAAGAHRRARCRNGGGLIGTPPFQHPGLHSGEEPSRRGAPARLTAKIAK